MNIFEKIKKAKQVPQEDIDSLAGQLKVDDKNVRYRSIHSLRDAMNIRLS